MIGWGLAPPKKLLKATELAYMTRWVKKASGAYMELSGRAVCGPLRKRRKRAPFVTSTQLVSLC